MKSLVSKLANIQRDLKAPKGQFNKFGKYAYRNCEDILEAVKPMLSGLVLTITDDVKQIGERFYIVATVALTDGENTISNQAMAREAATKKGMDESQITGAASSYARKYALNGLFLIDDTKDADSKAPEKEKPNEMDLSWVNAIKSGKAKSTEITNDGFRARIESFIKEGY